MTRRSSLRLGLALGLLRPLQALAEDRPLDLAVSLRDHEDRPLAGEPLRIVLGTAADWRDPGAGLRLRTDAKGTAAWSGSIPRETRLKRFTSNYVDTLLSLPHRVDWLHVAVELPFLGAPCLYTTELDWFAAQRTSAQSTAGTWWADEHGRFMLAPEPVGRPERDGGWRLPLPAWRHLMFTRLGHALEGSLMPADDGAGTPASAGGVPRSRVTLRIRRDPPPVMR
jgi:hypothetical protein